MAAAGTAIDFDEDGFDSGDHDDLAGLVMSWRISRGASAAITGGSTPGSATFTLKNPADIFNPRYESGDLFGKLRDGLPIWCGINNDGASAGSDAIGLFAGRTLDWEPILTSGATVAPEVRVTAEDCLGTYGRVDVQLPEAIGRAQGALREALLLAGGEDAGRIDLANEIRTLPISSWDGKLLAALEDINRANGTRHFCRPENDRADWYTYVTRNRQWRLDGTTDHVLDADDDHVTGVTGMTLSASTVVNRQKASVTPIHFTPSSTTVWKADVLPFTVAGTKVIWVEFDDYVKSPALDINFTGTTPTTDLEAFGRTAKITITSGGSTVVTGLSIEGALVRRGLGESHTADDTASQAGARGVRAGSEISGQMVGTLATATGIAEHVVWRYGNPTLRPTLTVVNWIPEQFEVEIGDIVAFTTAQGALDAVLFEVAGIVHECDFAASATERSHVTTLVVNECRVQADPGWFVLDSSELDGEHVLAY